jgi:CRP-like cAMP-binding protein
MEPQEISEIFPLFNPADPDTLEWLLSVAEEITYAPGSTIVEEEDWGKAVSLIISGWVKIQYNSGDRDQALDVVSRGDYFGVVAILDEGLRSTDAIALSEVRLLSISAQRFLQMLFKDSALQHRMLQLTVKKNRFFYRRIQLTHQSPTQKLIKTLSYFAEHYGITTENGTQIYNIPCQDLADLADITAENCQQILLKLQSKSWLELHGAQLTLTNLKQLHHFAKQP